MGMTRVPISTRGGMQSTPEIPLGNDGIYEAPSFTTEAHVQGNLHNVATKDHHDP